MRRPGEHVAGGDLLGGVAVFGEVFQVSGECRRVAGDVDHAPGSHFADGFHQLFAAALSRRVEDDDVRRHALLTELFGCRRRVGTEKTRVLNAVGGGVCLRVTDGVGNDLHADELFAVLRHGQSDRAGAAVQVEQDFAAGQSGVGLRLRVKALRLPAVDLPERKRRDTEAQAAQFVLDRAAAIGDAVFAAENDVCFFSVGIKNNGFQILGVLKKKLL